MKQVPAPNPHGIELYDITSIDIVEDVDGTWWLEAATVCGRRIAVIMFADSRFGVNVSEEGRTVREYSGGPGSHAEQVFRGFHDEYFGFRSTLDGAPPVTDTDRTR